MKFCSNCGKQLEDDAVFCDSCGTKAGGPAPSAGSAAPAGNPAQPAQAPMPPAGTNPYATSGAYGASGSGAYGASGSGAASSPGTPAATAQAPAAPVNPPYYQPGAPAPGSNTQSYGGTPPYGAQPYGGAPNNPNKSGGNKLVIIIVAVAVALALIAGGVFIWAKLAHKEPEPEPAISFSPSLEPSEEPEDYPSELPEVSGAAGLDMFDSATQENIIAAMEAINIDTSLVTGLDEYGSWNDGKIYSFNYKDSIFDMLLYDDGTVFSIETGGTQLYVKGYESYDAEDYLGSTSHFNEIYPDNGYVFYLSDTDVTCTLVTNTSADMDYIVELVDAASGDLVEAYYVQAGQNWSMAVPEGDYKIQYAAGTWVDYDSMFGDNGYYFVSDDTYSITPDSETTITIDPAGGTGIASTQITESEFFGS